MALADVPVDLILSCRDNNRPATEQLLRQISPDVYRIAYSVLHDHDDTDEVVQETLIRIFRYIGSLKEPERFASWVMRITINQVQTWRVRKGRRRFYELDDVLDLDEGVVVVGSGTGGRSPREEAIQSEVRGEIQRAMAALPDRQQTAVMLFELEGLSIREIAGVMNCSEGAVKFNIHEARKKLQRRLSHLVRGLFGRRHAADEAEAVAVADGTTKP
ncbi:RNA polymerase sigma factor [bacterium]|nr:RNA polymerase sigma factor [bacterium]